MPPMNSADPAVVTALVADHESLREFLLQKSEISFASVLEATTPKLALLSAASWLEARLQEILVAYYESILPAAPHAVTFVKNAGIERRYHSWFEWDRSNSNKFFALFGPDFKRLCAEEVRTSDTFELQMRSFMQIGSLRNSLVHGNFASFYLDKSAVEVDELFRNAVGFLNELSKLLQRMHAE